MAVPIMAAIAKNVVIMTLALPVNSGKKRQIGAEVWKI
jgi:hypothetical protein